MKTAFLGITLFLSAMSTHAQDLKKIIDGYVGFIGGKKSWHAVKTMSTAGEYDYGGMKFQFTSLQKAPNRYTFKVVLNNKFYAQGFDGTKGWKFDGFKNETAAMWLDGKAATQLANEADVELEDAFIHYSAKNHRAFLEGTDSVDGHTCFKVKLLHTNGDTATYYFDRDTYALRMKVARSKNTEMNGATLHIKYHDYRHVGVDGGWINVPFKIDNVLEGQMILQITIASITTNTPIDDKKFQP